MTSVKCSESVFTPSLLKARTQLADQAESYEKISSNVPEKGTLKQSFHAMSLIALASLSVASKIFRDNLCCQSGFPLYLIIIVTSRT